MPKRFFLMPLQSAMGTMKNMVLHAFGRKSTNRSNDTSLDDEFKREIENAIAHSNFQAKEGIANVCAEISKENTCADNTQKDTLSKEQMEINTAVQAERRRIAELDEIASLYDPEIIQAAKYGEDRCTAQELCHAMAKEKKMRGTNFLTALIEDYQASGASDISGVSLEPEYPRGLDSDEQTTLGQVYARQIQSE